MKKFFYSFIVLISFVATTYGQPPAPVPPTQEALLSASKVEGLELPASQTVNFDEGFVNLQAKCKGEVRWLVVAGSKVKYIVIPQTNSIIISIPPQQATITVFAVGLVDGKLTEFASTNIIVSQGPAPNPPPNPPPNPNPGPNPPPITGSLHITFFVDKNNITPELAQVLNSQNLIQYITQRNSFFRLYDLKSPIVAQKKLDVIVAKVGGSAVIVIQNSNGQVLDARSVPRTEQETIQIISRFFGGQ